MTVKICRDCLKEDGVMVGGGIAGRLVYPSHLNIRPIVNGSGGRCATHARLRKQASKASQHERYVQRVYGLGPGDYDRLYRHQGGRCYLCERSTGKVKKLAVDHDHGTGLVYGLLCGPCNKDVMGWSRREVAYFVRCLRYLDNPPARQLRIVAYHQDNRKEKSD